MSFRVSWNFQILPKQNNDKFLPVAELLVYFETNYIRNRVGRRQRPPRFPVELWNCHHETINDLPRTNNNVEAWHRAFEVRLDISEASSEIQRLTNFPFQTMIGAHHQELYRFLESLQLEQSLMETKRAKVDAGTAYPLYAKAMYRATNERLKNLIAGYTIPGREAFLRGCSHNYDL